MDLNDNGNEWDACISSADKEEEVRRLAVKSHASSMSNALWLSSSVQVSFCMCGGDDCLSSHIQVAEDLTDLERALVLVEGGHSVQQRSVIDRFA